MEAIFANIQNGLTSRILGFFSSAFCIHWYKVLVDSFLIRFWQFYILTQSDDFAKAIAFSWRPFSQYSKWSHFSNIRGFFQRFFAQNQYNVLIDSFLICFWQFHILTQSDDFAKAIAFSWRPFLPILKMVSFPKYQVFL